MGHGLRGRGVRDYLIFQLYGPFASWGDIAVGETRPSAMTPSRSAVLGLLAAALGLKRPDTAESEPEREEWEQAHAAVAQGYGLAMKVDYSGQPLSDYHTAQVPSSGKGKNRAVFPTRRDELLRMPRHDLNTILSRREYRQDAFAACALWARENAPHSLPALRDALGSPVFPLYLGRKSCPPAVPLDPQVVGAATIEAALECAGLAATLAKLDDFWKGHRPEAWLREADAYRPMLLWDDDAETGLSRDETYTRRDQPLSRRRWQFSVRSEHKTHLERKP